MPGKYQLQFKRVAKLMHKCNEMVRIICVDVLVLVSKILFNVTHNSFNNITV